MTAAFDLSKYSVLYVHQVKEMAELLGFETKNKYEILTESGTQIAMAVEDTQGFFGFIGRQFLGHWRPYTIKVFRPDLSPILELHHPFNFVLQRIEVHKAGAQKLGTIQERWSLLHKHFDLLDFNGQVTMQVRSPILKVWTFSFERSDGQTVAQVEKKWSGALKEVLTDADNFRVEFSAGNLSNDERLSILSAALFIDLRYFESKAG